MLFFYNLFLYAFSAGIHLASLWNPKARQWVNGRRSLLKRIKVAVAATEGPVIWMHCASLGEFEQGRPLLEDLKKRYPGHRILLTFFSPSGYEIKKNNSGADLVFYLPLDGKRNVQYFLDAVNPELVIFVKYESWHYYLTELKKRNIPTLLVSAIFKPEQTFFGIFGGFLRGLLENYSHIFVQDQDSFEILKKYGLRAEISIAGDTRFDRVTEIINQPFTHHHIESFCAGNQVLIAGSTWEEDEKMLADLSKQQPTLKMIIAPHEVSESAIQKTKERFDDSVLLSALESDLKKNNSTVLIIDCIGMLSKIYRYSTICYVGGGFNIAGIHNVLEPAAYGRVVIFGPNHQRSAEPEALIASGAGFSYQRRGTLIEIVERLLTDKRLLQEKNETARSFVDKRKGATKKITDYIEKNLRLSR